MKKFKLLVLTAMTLLFVGLGNVNAQEKNSQTVIIRTFELFVGKESNMLVTYPDGKTESIELKNIDFKDNAVRGHNLAIIQSEINKWKKQGFDIEGFSSPVAGNAIITTIILSKE